LALSPGRRPLIRGGIGGEQFRGRFRSAAFDRVLHPHVLLERGDGLGRRVDPVDRLGFHGAEVVDDVAEQVCRIKKAAAIFRIHVASNFLSNLTRVNAENPAIRGAVVEEIGVFVSGHGPSEALLTF